MRNSYFRRPLASVTVAATLTLLVPAGLAASPLAREGRETSRGAAAAAVRCLSPWTLMVRLLEKVSDVLPGPQGTDAPADPRPERMGVRIDPNGNS